MKQTYHETRRLIRADIAWRCLFEKKQVSRLTALRLMSHPGVATVLLFRWQRFFDDHHLGALGSFCRWLNLFLFTSAFSSKAEIAGGFMVVHATANYVDDGVVIGPRCIFFSQNSLARSPFIGSTPTAANAGTAVTAVETSSPPAGVPLNGGVPVVENDVTFGMGACAHGDIRIAALSKIGPNTLVDFSTQPNSSLLGVPARVVGHRPRPPE